MESHLGHSISLCARATRAILNHAPIGEYKATFFPQETSTCPCGQSDIKNILTEYPRFTKDRATSPSPCIGNFIKFSLPLPIRPFLPSQHPGNLHTHDDHPTCPLRPERASQDPSEIHVLTALRFPSPVLSHLCPVSSRGTEPGLIVSDSISQDPVL